MPSATLTFDEAWQTISHHLPRPLRASETLSAEAAVGRVLAGDVRAVLDAPPFSRAMMDGYAVRVADLHGSCPQLSVQGLALAGQAPQTSITPGCAVRIMTGAAMPPGADAVVRQEWCDVAADGRTVTILRPVLQGESVQSAGEDGRAGQALLRAGERVSPLHLGALCTFGAHQVEVQPRLRVSVLPTGNEVIANRQQQLRPGQVYDANSPLLAACLRADGCAVQVAPVLADEWDLVAGALRAALMESDVVLLTGGASKGDMDFVPRVLHDLAAAARTVDESAQPAGTVWFSRVQMRPGSPLVFARFGDTLVFALSGNPAAAYIQFEALIRPALRRLQGQDDQPFGHTAHLVHAPDLPPIVHTRILRGRASIDAGRLQVDTRFAQSPGAMSSFLTSNCLVRWEASNGGDEPVPVRLLDLPARVGDGGWCLHGGS